MSIDIQSIKAQKDELISFAQAARATPGAPHIATLHRWRLRGIQGIRLWTCRVGGRRFTSLAAIEAFIAATTAAADGTVLPVRTPKQRARAIETAEREIGCEDTVGQFSDHVDTRPETK